ncbi:conjugative transposon protein TraM [Sphingobacterium phlebotomi]|uniref:Conjugative transposon protein TraM n=1 Tax=Sphingobacterium phlebotomi TaxID=2605433 RepID=A0A5D4H965_9SPHI|nr:conjugative transposon protein TraM [Sphingobacterium phlebotomi]TYR37406.1 conjugative transposon protein TraM [Sphingobacterium phlebotomi]
METKSENYQKRRKFLIALPLLVLPFMTFAFWALGGGKGSQDNENQQHLGINTELPEARLEDNALDKMSLYRDVEPENDGEIDEGVDPDSMDEELDEFMSEEEFESYAFREDHVDSERELRRRIAELERTIALQETSTNEPISELYAERESIDSDASLKRLEAMMQRMEEPSLPDPELEVLDGMLEKIMDIQHPDRVQERIRSQSEQQRGIVFPVNGKTRKNAVSIVHRTSESGLNRVDTSLVLSHEEENVRNGFFTLTVHGLNDPIGIGETTGITAVVHETKTVISGSNLKLRLTDDIYVNGIRIPAGNFLTGICDLRNERLQVKVSGIQYGNYQLPVSLTVYDSDGVEGINIPGAISRDAAKEGSQRAVQSMQFMSMDPSLLTQATGAGIEAAKGLFSKKVRLISGTVKAGHPVLLFDEQANRNN